MATNSYEGRVCTGCGKHVTGTTPAAQCADCGGAWVAATPDRLACDRCGGPDACRVLNSEHDRLCDDCIDDENSDNPPCPECDRRLVVDADGEWCPGCGLMRDQGGADDDE